MDRQDTDRPPRPPNVKEIVTAAEDFDFNVTISFSHWIRAAETLYHEGYYALKEGDLSRAYLMLWRHSKLVVDAMREHPEYPANINLVRRLHGRQEKIFADLEQMKPRIERDYADWMADQEARKQRRDQLQGQARSFVPGTAYSTPASPTTTDHPSVARRGFGIRAPSKTADDVGEQQPPLGDVQVGGGRKVRYSSVPDTDDDFRQNLEMARRQLDARGIDSRGKAPAGGKEREASHDWVEYGAGPWYNSYPTVPRSSRPVATTAPPRRSSPEKNNVGPYVSPPPRPPPPACLVFFCFFFFSRLDAAPGTAQDRVLLVVVVVAVVPPGPVAVRAAKRAVGAVFAGVVRPPTGHGPSRAPAQLPAPPQRPPKEAVARPVSPSQGTTVSSSSAAASSSSSSRRSFVPQLASAGRSRFKTTARLESGEPLRAVIISPALRTAFLEEARHHTARGIEFCGILCGRLSAGALVIDTCLIPDQRGEANKCETENEGNIAMHCAEHNLMQIGWIHTHPTQTCFMSSLDMHTHAGYQMMLAESIAIVCAPRENPSYAIFRMTDPPGMKNIISCKGPSGDFHSHEESNNYTDARYPEGHVFEHAGAPYCVVDIRTREKF